MLRKQTCRDCHYLNKLYINLHGRQGNQTWDDEDRRKMRLKELGPDRGFVASCWKGQWDAGVDSSVVERMPEILTQNRRGKCAFVKYRKSMTYHGANIHYNALQQNANKWRFIVAMGISAGALLVSVIALMS